MKAGKLAMMAAATLLLGACGGSGDDSSGGSNGDLFSEVNALKAAADNFAKNGNQLDVTGTFFYNGKNYIVGDKFDVSEYKQGEIAVLDNVKVNVNGDVKDGKLAIYKGNLANFMWTLAGDRFTVPASYVSPNDEGNLAKFKEKSAVLTYEGKAYTKDFSEYGKFDYKIDFGKMQGQGSVEITDADEKDVKKLELQPAKIAYGNYFNMRLGKILFEMKDGSKQKPMNEEHALYTVRLSGKYMEAVDGIVSYAHPKTMKGNSVAVIGERTK